MLQCKLYRCSCCHSCLYPILLQIIKNLIKTGLFFETIFFKSFCYKSTSDFADCKIVKILSKYPLHHLCCHICITASEHKCMFTSKIIAKASGCFLPGFIVMLFCIYKDTIHIKNYRFYHQILPPFVLSQLYQKTGDISIRYPPFFVIVKFFRKVCYKLINILLFAIA